MQPFAFFTERRLVALTGAQRTMQLLAGHMLCEPIGENGYQHVKQNFLLTRHVKDYMSVMLAWSIR